MPGDYLQCLPMPEKDNEFILVQPACFKNQKVMDTQMGLVKNATKFGEQNNDLMIEAEGYAQEEIIDDQYSIISYWKYDKKAFSCTHSFTSPAIIPIEHASRDKFKNTYITVGRNGGLYYFCEGTTTDIKYNGDDKPLYLCEIIKADNSKIDGEE